MPRARKGRAPKATKPWREQANKLLVSRYLDLSSRHALKQEKGLAGNQTTGKIHALATLQKYEISLANAGRWIEQNFGIKRLDAITKEHAVAYLAHRKSEVRQKQLSQDRNALEKCKKVGGLDRIKSDLRIKKTGRAYTPHQIDLIAKDQMPRHALATRIAHNAGLRAKELLTLQRADEGGASPHRTWRQDRFLGRSGVRYLVTGKGGLTREVLLSHELSRALEERRLDEPRTVKDREIIYQARYDIGGGQSWSAAVTNAAKRVLGWSSGAHGLRHTYAQERLKELQSKRYTYSVAKQVLSQELGHFREDVVNEYLR